MPITTIYDVKTRYLVEDKTRRPLRVLGGRADKVGKSFKRAKTSASAFGAALRFIGPLAIAAGVVKLTKSVIGLNKEFENLTISSAGLLQLNLGGSFQENFAKSTKLIKQFRKDSEQSVKTAKDFAEFSSLVVGPITRIGGSVDQVRQITKGAVVAAGAFGVQGEVAARDIEQALAGTLGKKDRFARAILEPFLKKKGVKKDFTAFWNQVIKQSPDQAVKLLTEALNQKAIKDLSKAQAKTLDGAFSTFTGKLQNLIVDFTGGVGTSVATMFARMSQLLDKNKADIQLIVENIKVGLGAVGQIARFISKAFGVAVQATKFIGKSALETFNIISRASGGLLGKADTSKKKKQSSNLSFGVGGLESGLSTIGQNNVKTIFNNRKTAKVFTAAANKAREEGLIKSIKGDVDFGKVASSIGLASVDPRKARLLAKAESFDEARNLIKTVGLSNEPRVLNVLNGLEKISNQIKSGTSAQAARDNGSTSRSLSKATTNVNVKISRIEVASEDPDRFAVGLVNQFQSLAKTGTQAHTALREG